MDKDKKRNISIILLIILALLMIGFIVWWQFFRQEPVAEVVTTNSNTNTKVQEIIINTNAGNTDLNINTEVVIEENLSIQRLSNIFAERFGSYTSVSEYVNTMGLKEYMTDSMKTWADNYVATQKELPSTDKYYSVVTKVLNTKILTQDDVNAKIELLTQRVESGDDFEVDNTFSQIMTLELKKISDDWLVNKATWGNIQ